MPFNCRSGRSMLLSVGLAPITFWCCGWQLWSCKFWQLWSCKKTRDLNGSQKHSSDSSVVEFTSHHYISQRVAFRSAEWYLHREYRVLLDEPITTGAVPPIHMNRASSHDDGPFIRAGWWQLRQGSTTSTFRRSTLQPFHGRQWVQSVQWCTRCTMKFLSPKLAPFQAWDAWEVKCDQWFTMIPVKTQVVMVLSRA